MPSISFRTDESTKAALDAEAENRDISRSEYINEIVSQRNTADADSEELRNEIRQLEQKVDELTQERNSYREQLNVIQNSPVTEYVDAVNEMLEEHRADVRSDLQEIANNSNSKALEKEKRLRKARELDIKRLENHRDDLATERDTAVAERQRHIREVKRELDNLNSRIDEMQRPRREKFVDWLVDRVPFLPINA